MSAYTSGFASVSTAEGKKSTCSLDSADAYTKQLPQSAAQKLKQNKKEFVWVNEPSAELFTHASTFPEYMLSTEMEKPHAIKELKCLIEKCSKLTTNHNSGYSEIYS